VAALRPYDTVGRYGGEEFLIVLPGCDADAGTVLAERLRRSFDSEPVTDGHHAHRVTLSMGIATWDGVMAAGELLRRADEGLYAAKGAGRNCVVRLDRSPESAR
jgi:diguanylate cyclase (GGDEF)-like protein